MIAAIEKAAIKNYVFYCGALLLRRHGRNRGGVPQLERFYTVPKQYFDQRIRGAATHSRASLKGSDNYWPEPESLRVP